MNHNSSNRPLRVLVAGLGQMGRSHALAYHKNPAFEVIGLFNRTKVELPKELNGYKIVDSFEAGLALRPDVVSINTYTDSHADLAIRAMEAGAHIFVEKPLALTIDSAREVVSVARKTNRKLVIGYILRHHPSWMEFIKTARELGAPYVMRLNLNQPSVGAAWEIHKRLLETTPPFVDCGVHYVDVMCQISGTRPVQVRGMGVRLAEDIPNDQVNYSHLQVIFEDGSVGWYEAGWGPMISGTSCFVKNVIGKRGAVSLVMGDDADPADINSHTRAGQLCLRVASAEKGSEDYTEAFVTLGDTVDHQSLCDREQEFLAQAIANDLDLTNHHADALRSLEIVLAAERSMRERRAIDI
ncbi:Gfo/Idh/MocA family oxidoreductase [Noviherbaspirillum sp.]|uniref:Gfo/Idh/MocA family protein n=1 Tax=Noviherbaspirillum sp. TaxID=1926288 RepID=UPI0025DAA764|nr:Gfo/Idh/MocA family oxidoreductase [Noviherbaspirillum sp.]